MMNKSTIKLALIALFNDHSYCISYMYNNELISSHQQQQQHQPNDELYAKEIDVENSRLFDEKFSAAGCLGKQRATQLAQAFELASITTLDATMAAISSSNNSDATAVGHFVKKYQQKEAARRYRSKIRMEKSYHLKQYDYEHDRNRELQELVHTIKYILKSLVKTAYESVSEKESMKETLSLNNLKFSLQYFDEVSIVSKRQNMLINAFEPSKKDDSLNNKKQKVNDDQEKFIYSLVDEDMETEMAIGNNFQELFQPTQHQQHQMIIQQHAF